MSLQISQEAREIVGRCQEMRTPKCICVNARCTEVYVNTHYQQEGKASRSGRTEYIACTICVSVRTHWSTATTDQSCSRTSTAQVPVCVTVAITENIDLQFIKHHRSGATLMLSMPRTIISFNSQNNFMFILIFKFKGSK